MRLIFLHRCVGLVPWSGCNEPHLELQFTTRKRGITVDSDNFPPRLQKVLENGLQLDAAKRTLDMNKIRKSLHRLLVRISAYIFLELAQLLMIRDSSSNDFMFARIIFSFFLFFFFYLKMSEEAGTPYMNESVTLKFERNNNIKNMYTSTPIAPSYENIIIRKSSPDKSDHMTEERLSNRLFASTMVQCNRDLDKNNAKKKNILNGNSTERFATEVQTINHGTDTKRLNGANKLETEVELQNTTRSDIKRLKEINASRREYFFNGNKPSFASSTPSKRVEYLR